MVALLVVAAMGAGVTATLSPKLLAATLFEYGLTLFAAGAALWSARRHDVATLSRWAVMAAAVSTALLWSPLGVERMAAHRHIHLGPLVLQPSVLWVLASHSSAAVVACGGLQHWPWLLVSLTGSLVSALAMPELSIVPQVTAGLLVVSWMTGRRRLAIAAVFAIALAIAATALLPYVRRRWIGFLDPDGHARGAGYDYRGLRRLVSQALWFGPPEGTMPRTSSPADDYWLAAGMWRLGRLPMLAWTAALVASLLQVRRVRATSTAAQDLAPVPLSPSLLLAHAFAASVLASMAIHAGYNLGLWPITAISAPLSGNIGAVTAVTAFGICFGVTRASRPDR